MLEDAVGLYAQLGNNYPNITVRDGKTGADYLNDLLTDKRLLPYLEPTRVPTPDRIKVEQQSGGTRIDQTVGFTFEPEGDLLPFFRRFRMSLGSNDQQNGTWALRVTDRNTGEERCKFTGLRVYTPNGAPQYRVGIAHGHMLLLHHGPVAYCFDLAEKKELWQYNLLGDGSRVDPNNVQYDTGPDGDMTITYLADGFKIRFGRSAILEANFACLLTRDGLVALDPATGAKLWTRSNISLSAQVFGDARHVFVVESEGGKAQSRVLRAVDGATVEGVPPFGELFTGNARAGTFGRLILLNEGGGGKPRQLRLYDPLTGKDVWAKKYGPDAKFIETLTADYVGVIEPSGAFDVLDARTGKPVFAGQVDAANLDAHVKPANTPALLHDAERFYLLLNKNQPSTRRAAYYGYKPLRDTTVSGPVYAFDRVSGKRLWYTDKLFEGQSLITERFADTPAIVAATATTEEGTNVGVYRVIVVDKRNGKIRYLKPLQQAGVFSAIVPDPRDGSTRFVRGDVTVRISPDEPDKTAAKP
jgi:outer membrane protein assembly factor BamB